MHTYVRTQQQKYLVSIIFLAASAYLDSCFRASPVNFGRSSFMGKSFIISLYMESETSGWHWPGKSGSVPLSTTFLSSSQRLNESLGASIAIFDKTQNDFKMSSRLR
jgi:hypothetical protein